MKYNEYSGSSIWSFMYALRAIRGNTLRSIGIVLILASGVSLAPAIMNWTSTGISIALDDYVENSVYQFGIQPHEPNDLEGYQGLMEAHEICEAHPWVKKTHQVLSTVCLVDGHLQPEFTYPFNFDYFYQVYGVKDASALMVNNDMLETWEPFFKWEGELRIGLNECVVSERFLDYTEMVSGIRYVIGSSINIDLVLGVRGTYPALSGDRRSSIMDLTIVGISKLVKAPTILGDAFHGFGRLMFDPYNEYTFFGLYDSIWIHQDRVPDEVTEEIARRSFFPTASLIQADSDGLISSGEEKAGENLRSLIARLGEDQTISVWGTQEIARFENHVTVYLNSRLIIALGLPTLLIAIFLAVNASESSVSRRKGEMSLLRSKGASYNQILSSYMWESIILSVVSLFLGILASIPFSASIGASTGLLTFDESMFFLFADNLIIPPMGVFLAGGISLCLPMTYMIHVARLVDVTEVGRPLEDAGDDISDETNMWRLVVGLAITVVYIVVVPFVLPPTTAATIGAILLSTVVLYIASYYGTKLARRAVGRLADGAGFVLGEKSLYLAKSLRKRKGQHLPFLILLTLILTSSTMLFVQYNSFSSNLENEMEYAIGADIRIEVDRVSVFTNQTYYQTAGVHEVTPVMDQTVIIGTDQIHTIGVDALTYSRVGRFDSASFVTGSSTQVLTALEQQRDGIIISEYHAMIWNKSIGDIIDTFATFTIVGVMRHLPGFGFASTQDKPSNTMASNLETQVLGDGFVLVNLDYMMESNGRSRVDLFLASILDYSNATSTLRALSQRADTDVRSPLTRNFLWTGLSTKLFLTGLAGLLSITVLISIGMSVFAVLTMLSSSVNTRKTEYAILRAVGSTKRQITTLVIGEFVAVVLAVVVLSAMFGVGFGSFLGQMTFSLSPYSPLLPQPMVVPMTTLGVLIGLQTLLMVLSSIIPARLANRTDPAIQLRNL
ncbi:MAG: ABC transporter permease [Candidatus Thorarchaeota archaeon]